MILSLLVAAILAQTPSTSALLDSTDQGVPFNFVDDGLVVVPVRLNGHAGYKFLLDTGASHTILSTDVAGQLRIPVGEPATLTTVDGKIPITIRMVDLVQIGDLKIRHAHIAVADWAMMRTLHVDGILGADFLRPFKVSIDYNRKLLTINPS